MELTKLKILHKNDLLPDIFTRYPSFYIFSKLLYKEEKIKYINTDKGNLLYIHIPFCLSICDFCNLYKIPYKNNKQISEYIDILIKELKEKSKNIKGKFSGIWIGGGTPNIINDLETKRLFDTIFDNFSFEDKYSFEIDIHPNFITEEKVFIYKKYGVDLLSVGIQSFEDTILKNINRGVQNNINLLEKLNIINKNNINLHVDFIVGLPNDNYSIEFSKIDNLFEKINVFSTSINKYENNINTKLYKNGYREENNILKLQKVGEIEKYILEKFGVRREKSFFIKHFFTSRYNVISCGAGAFGYIKDFGVYRNSLYNNYIKGENQIKLFQFDNEEDKIMYILNNWDIEELSFLYKEQYGTYMLEDFNVFFNKLEEKYYKKITDLHIKFLFQSDYIAKFKLIDLYFDKINKYYES